MYFCVNTEKSLVISKNELATVFYSAVTLGTGQLHDFVSVSFVLLSLPPLRPQRGKRPPCLVPFLSQ